jgi:hypothetical protein
MEEEVTRTLYRLTFNAFFYREYTATVPAQCPSFNLMRGKRIENDPSASRNPVAPPEWRAGFCILGTVRLTNGELDTRD